MPSTIIALHYWAGAGHEFDALRPLLPAGTHLLAPDLPGYGRQPVPPGFDFSAGSYADWVADFIARHEVPDYTLVGHSMGGKYALALAARRPAGLRRLVLLSPSPPAGEPMSEADRGAALAAYGQRPEAEKTFAKVTQRPLPVEIREQVIADNLLADHAAWNYWLRTGTREDISALMPQLQVPVHLLVGADDRAIAPATQQRQTLPLLPAGTAFTVVPEAGHLLPLEAMGEVAKACSAKP